jgi:predicted ATPase
MRGHSLEVIMLHTLAVSNYRSLRQFIAPLGELTLITGPNGSGKSNVYRALRLLAETARGGLIASLAREGGSASTLWAGPESFAGAVKRGEHSVQATMPTESQALRLGFRGDDFSYAIDLGLPIPSGSAFAGDPEIKTEVIWHGEQLRPASQLVERRNAVVRIRRDNGEWDLVTSHPPRLMVLNEPESSLHPDLLPALARLIGVAAKSTQIFVVSHASRLIAALKENSACLSIELDKQLSETQILGQGRLDVPSWRWLSR